MHEIWRLIEDGGIEDDRIPALNLRSYGTNQQRLMQARWNSNRRALDTLDNVIETELDSITINYYRNPRTSLLVVPKDIHVSMTALLQPVLNVK